MKKVQSVVDAVSHIKNGSSLMYGGFGGIGNPPTLIKALLDNGTKDLTLIGNDSGFPQVGIGQLISAGRAEKLIVSHIGSNPNAGKQMHDGTLTIEFSPQGTLVERIRAGGAGLGGILTDIGIDGLVAENKRKIDVDGSFFYLKSRLLLMLPLCMRKKRIRPAI